MNIRTLTTICCMIVGICCMAQRKELSQAKTYIKSGKDFDKAEKLMTGLLAKDSVNRQNKKIYQMWLLAVRKQYEAANEKLYLRQKYDTAQFFGLVRRMYQISVSLDSLDAKPDKKGRVRPEYRKDNAFYLDKLRRNLYYGGTFQVREGVFDDAYSYFETYLATCSQPLFTGYNYAKEDSLIPQVAYWATFSGYHRQRADSVLRYSKLALRDTSRQEYTLQYICEAYRWQRNDSGYVSTLHEGFKLFPRHQYFFPRLADYYNQHGESEKVLKLAEQGLMADSLNQLMLLAKSVAQLNMGDDEGCIATSERLIALNDTPARGLFQSCYCETE